jgi:hypothetical protein
MNDLRVPGLLIDAHTILLVMQEEDAPYEEIVRGKATPEDIDRIRMHLLLKSRNEFGS